LDNEFELRKLVSPEFVLGSGDRDHVNIITDVDDVFLDVDTAIPCGLIINELLTNSLKHAFPNQTNRQINIKLYAK